MATRSYWLKGWMPMPTVRRVVLLTALALLVTQVAQGAPSPAAQLDDDFQALRVAGIIGLTAAQATALLPLLQQAQDVLKTRQTSLDAAMARAEAPISAVNRAWERGLDARAADLAAADEAALAHSRAMDDAETALKGIGDQVMALLTDDQRALIETSEQAQVRASNRILYDGRDSLVEFIASDVALLRDVEAEEYAAARVTVAMNLATKISTVEAPDFPVIVNRVLRVGDVVRRLSDADYDALRDDLPGRVGQALELGPDMLPVDVPVRAEDFRHFLTYARTAELLQGYSPAAPAPAPAEGGANQ